MNSVKRSTCRTIIRISAILFFAALLAIINIIIISVQSSTAASIPIRPKPLTETVQAEAFSSSTPALDITPTFTTYLPLITGGSGSAGGQPVCEPTQGSGGLESGIYDTTVAGQKATVIVGEGYDPQTPTYLVFYLHGDEGGYSQFLSPYHPVTKLIRERGWVFVAPLAPNAETSWWRDPAPHIIALSEVFDEMYADYNVCRETLLGGVLSGGSTFYARNFFPNRGGQYPAHTTLFCGGVKPGQEDADRVMALGQNPDIVARSSFKFTYGTEDFLFDHIQATMSLYTEAGFKVIKEELPGVGHCVPYASTSRLKDYLEEKAAELGLD